MEARKEQEFGVSAETAPLIIEALRIYARMHAGEPAKYSYAKCQFGLQPSIRSNADGKQGKLAVRR
jgi:hypothetical protein